jgi:hypothetical protein
MEREEEILGLLREIRDVQKIHYNEWKTELANAKKKNEEVYEADMKRFKKVSRRINLFIIGTVVLLALMWLPSLLPSCLYRFMPHQDYSYLTGQERYEARDWLNKNANPFPLASNRFGEKQNASAFVDQLYQAGAETVYVVRVMNDPQTIQEEGGPYADCLVVVLPEEKEKRIRLFELAGSEAIKEGFDPEQDRGQKELFLWWD